MSTETEPHALVYRSKAALNAVKELIGDRDSMDLVNGWGLYCLLDLVAEELSEALEIMGGDPDKIRENLKGIKNQKDKH